MIQAINIPAGRSPATMIDFDPLRYPASYPCVPALVDQAVGYPKCVSAFGLERQMAVLLYDDSAADRGDLLNSTVLEILPDSFISPSGRTLVYGRAVIVGFHDRRGRWTSVPPDLIRELVWANRFWVEVRRSLQDPGEQVGPVYGSRDAALDARDRWRNVILDRGIAGAEVSVAAEVGSSPSPATDVAIADMHQSIDGWQERPLADTTRRVPQTSAAAQPVGHPSRRVRRLLERLRRR